MPEDPQPLRGRQAEALRNDAAILEAARVVFLRDPTAPISAVAEEAGVGVGGIYRRFAGKDELLRTLCGNGLRHFADLAQEAVDAVAGGEDAWAAFTRFVTGVVESDVHSLTVHLAGTFRSTEELRALAVGAGELVGVLVEQAHRAGRLRPDVTATDLPMLFEQLSAVRVEDEGRTSDLRRRYLTLHLAALHPTEPGTEPHTQPGTLPGPPPTPEELNERWRRSH